jgi:membrane-associated phospholipid phosphatase
MSGPEKSDEGTRAELSQDTTVGSQNLTRWDTRLGRGLAHGVQGLSERLGAHGALLLILAFGMILVVALSALAAQIYDSIVDVDGVAGLDRPLLDFAISIRSPWPDAIITGYTEIAGPIGMPVIAIITILILAIHRKSWTPVILIVAAGGGSLLMTIAGKDLIGRVRPPLADAVPPYDYSASFPSGHTLNAVAVVGIIAYLFILRQKSAQARLLTGAGAALFAITIGFTRVYLGHHWFTDVLAGWGLGAAWLALVITSHRLYLTVRARREARRRIVGS